MVNSYKYFNMEFSRANQYHVPTDLGCLRNPKKTDIHSISRKWR